jgi:hypothetical protein
MTRFLFWDERYNRSVGPACATPLFAEFACFLMVAGNAF